MKKEINSKIGRGRAGQRLLKKALLLFIMGNLLIIPNITINANNPYGYPNPGWHNGGSDHNPDYGSGDGDGSTEYGSSIYAGSGNDYTTAFGNWVVAYGNRSVAIGHGTQVSPKADSSIALGSETYVGYHAVLSEALGGSAYVVPEVAYATALGGQSIANESYTVSIGNSTIKRKIVNMKAGTAADNGATVAQTITLQNGTNSIAANKGTNTIGQTIYQIDVEGKGKIANNDTGLINGNTAYNELRPTNDGTYIKNSQTTAQNLTNLDTQVKNNETSITNLENGEGFTDKGNTYIKKLAQDAVTVKAGNRVTVTDNKDEDGNTNYTISVNNDGQIIKGDTNLVSGDTVAKAIENLSGTTDNKLFGKADINAGNIGENLNGTEAQKKQNENEWGKAIGTGEIEKGDNRLVTGNTVNNAIEKVTEKINDNKQYVDDELNKKANVDGSNIDKDKFSEAVAVGNVTKGDNRAVSGDTVNTAISNITNNMNQKLDDKANTNMDNLTETGKNNIKELAKGSIDIVNGQNTTVSKKSEKGKDIYAINVSNENIINAMKPEMDKKADKDEVNNKFTEIDNNLANKADRNAENLSGEDISSWQKKLGNGTIEKGNTGLVNGNTVYETVQNLKENNLIQTDHKTITIGAKDESNKIDIHNNNKERRVITGIKTDENDPESAANVSYVQKGINTLANDMNRSYARLNKNINKAAAGANALAALHPLDYDPDDKANYAVGYGHYKDSNAAAVGMFYYPNASTMVSVGATIGNGDAGVNAGISFKVGKGSAYNGISKTDLVKENKEMKAKMDTMEERMDAMAKAIDKLQGKPVQEIQNEPVQKDIKEPIIEETIIEKSIPTEQNNKEKPETKADEKTEQEELDELLKGIE